MRAHASLIFLVAAALAGCGGGSGTGSGTAGQGGGAAGGRGGATGGASGRGGASDSAGSSGSGGSAGAAGTGGAGGAGGSGGAAGNAGTAGAAGGSGGAAGNAGTAGAAAGRGGSTGGTGGVAGAAGTAGSIGGTGGGAGNAGTGGAAGIGVAGAAGTVVDGGSMDGSCAAVDQPVLGFRPDILVLLDASGSMNEDETGQQCGSTGCGLNSKWALTSAAVNQVVGMTDGTVNWGLKFFAESGTCGVASTVAVPVGPGNALAIATAIAGRTTATGGVANGSNTPTRAAENAAVAYLSTVVDTNPKFILLATDGLPNCPLSGNIGNDDSAPAVQAVSNAYGAGIATFVVGVAVAGLPTADVTLSSMATAGGRPRPATPAYYPITSTSELVATLNQLIGIARSCRFTLASPPGFSGDEIDVVGDGVSIPRDANHTNGWDYSDASHTGIDLFGPACSGVTSEATAQVSVVYRCPPAG